MLNLKVLWDDLAKRHQEPAGKPKPSGFQLFNRVTDDLRRMLAEHSRPYRLKLSVDSSAVQPSACGQCGATDLLHFFTSWKTGQTLCERCFKEHVGETAQQRASPHDPSAISDQPSA
jgi:hypothetical protein